MTESTEHANAATPDALVVIRFAADALRAALLDNWDRAYSTVCLGAVLFPSYVALMVQTWCDMYLDHARGGDGRIGLGHWTTLGADGKPLHPDSDEIPASIKWARRALEARARMDVEAYVEAFDAMPSDPDEYTEHILAVLHVVTSTLSVTKRGFARNSEQSWMSLN
ncbi:MAG: hypothetical protein M3N52_11860 [Actinomycetota bacterium]|nr:hypothetical protein [Actinomycetota bacterium]